MNPQYKVRSNPAELVPLHTADAGAFATGRELAGGLTLHVSQKHSTESRLISDGKKLNTPTNKQTTTAAKHQTPTKRRSYSGGRTKIKRFLQPCLYILKAALPASYRRGRSRRLSSRAGTGRTRLSKETKGHWEIFPRDCAPF